MCETEGLEKSMQVGDKDKSYSYKAISEKVVLNAVKPLLKKNRLIVFPVEVSIEENNTRKMTQLKVKWKIVDIDSGEFEYLESPGNGADSQDKGSGKAWTYAYKALFQKTLCMFSGEDTDNEHSKDLDKKLAPIPCTDLINVGHKKGYNAKAIETSLVKAYGRGMEYITQAEHDETLAKLTALPDKE